MNGWNGFHRVPERVETSITQFQAELIFGFRVKGAMAFAAGRILRALKLLFDVYAGLKL